MSRIRRAAVALAALFAMLWAGPAAAEFAGSYKLPAKWDPVVRTNATYKERTELWAGVWRPRSDRRAQLILILHGNHFTCGRDLGEYNISDSNDYAVSGTCPPKQIGSTTWDYKVTASHLGFGYLANALADQGYVVVSINSNRGINGEGFGIHGDVGDPRLVYARARLVLRHLQQLARWKTSGGAPVALPPIDFGHVGLIGHSRGGEAMRLVPKLYREETVWQTRIPATVRFDALYELAPTDGLAHPRPDAFNINWGVLLPGCDGDGIGLPNLGSQPFDRNLRKIDETRPFRKSTLVVYGANHNFFNTEWHTTDTYPVHQTCDNQRPIFEQVDRFPRTLDSQPQRRIARDAVLAFFKAFLGPNANVSKERFFDPSYPLPEGLQEITLYARGFTPTPLARQNYIVDNFDRNGQISTANVPNDSSGLRLYVHTQADVPDPGQRGAVILWERNGGFLQVNAAGANGPFIDIRSKGFKTLEFRVLLICDRPELCPGTPDPKGDLDFSIALANGKTNGTQTFSKRISLKDEAAIYRQPREVQTTKYYKNVLTTVRIPLSEFTGADLTKFKGVRFIFNKTPAARINLANVRFTKQRAGPGAPVTTIPEPYR